MWQRFTERARRVILLAQEEAGKMSAGHVGTEHLLLGLVREDEGVAAQILGQMGVGLAVVRAAVLAASEPADAPATSEPKLTPKAKRILELAADEARRMKHSYIGTEHLLLGLLRERDGQGAIVLRELGLDLESVRAQVLDYLPPVALSTRLGSAASTGRYSEVINDAGFVQILHWMFQSENAASKILAECGLDIEAARQKTKQFLEEDTP